MTGQPPLLSALPLAAAQPLPVPAQPMTKQWSLLMPMLTCYEDLNMIAIIGISDQPCWLAEACKILLLLLCCASFHKLLGNNVRQCIHSDVRLVGLRQNSDCV